MIRSTFKNRFLLPMFFGMCLGGTALAQAPAVAPAPGTPPPPPAPAPTAVKAAPAAAPAAPAEIDANSLLKKVDGQLNAFADATFTFKLIIKDTPQREVEFTTIQKGEKRLVRFLSPGNIKGMGILVESASSMYAMLPEFNNRVRRIGSHQMGQSFMGSDVTSDDMSTVSFAPIYTPKLVGTEGDLVILDLTLIPGKQAAFPRVKLWVEKHRSIITKLEFYDASGKKLRSQFREDYKQDPGASHFSPWRMRFVDHIRNNHESELQLQSIKVNTGLKDDEFNVRALQKNN